MLGKASEIKTTGYLKHIDRVDEFLEKNPGATILQILISPHQETGIDYFYIIYKEETTHDQA